MDLAAQGLLPLSINEQSLFLNVTDLQHRVWLFALGLLLTFTTVSSREVLSQRLQWVRFLAHVSGKLYAFQFSCGQFINCKSIN